MSNMYPWIDANFNTVKGKCPHGCAYCYMSRFEQPPLHFDEFELRRKPKPGLTYFVVSGCDLFAEAIPEEWILRTLGHIAKFPESTFLLQTKNPRRFLDFELPRNSILCTTIETNRRYAQMGNTPEPLKRAAAIRDAALYFNLPAVVTIEPVMDFDLFNMTCLIHMVHPPWVNIGADSKRHGLPEPSADKLRELIAALSKFTEGRQKDNLRRLL